jgi:portal protein
LSRKARSAQVEKAENDSFLTKARDRFKYCLESWKEIREEHDLDMKFLAGDSWDEREKSRRKDKHMPMIHLDELTQFINQLINDVRQNKRAVNVLPKGSGATDETAKLRADWVRAVEYISQAQTAYTTAFEGAAGGSYGFWKLETYYDGESFNLNVRIVPVPNANTILMDPDCIQYDCSDGEDAFEINFMSEEKFNREYPGAEIKTFAEDIQAIAPDWIKPKQVQVASWWKVEKEQIQLHLVDIGNGQMKVMREKQLPEKFDRGKILKTRDYCDRRVVQYVLNGVEVLETNDPNKGKGWPGQWIPIIPVWGKELFVDEGSGSKRMLFSLIRLARDPQRLLNYYAAQEMAEARLSPRTPYMGPVGMFSAQTKDWEEINDTPKAFIEYATPDGFQPGSVEPKRVPFVPNFQAYEVAKEAASRSIMKAMGISPLPIDAQRANNKSGIALKKIQGERAQGSFHFIDNFDRSIVYCGRQLDDIFEKIHDTARDIPARKEDGTHYVARINDPSDPKNKLFAGDHDVTITTGPSYDSEREEAADFADTLANIQGVFPLIGDLIVRLRNIGPIGEQIAERLTPPQFAAQGMEDLPPKAQSAIGQANQKIQQLTQIIQQLQQEKAAKMVEKSVALQQTALQEKTKLIVAQATLNRDQAEMILQAELDNVNTILDQLHEHATIAHQADQDRATAAHAASLQPPPSSNGNQPAGQ